MALQEVQLHQLVIDKHYRINSQGGPLLEEMVRPDVLAYAGFEDGMEWFSRQEAQTGEQEAHAPVNLRTFVDSTCLIADFMEKIFKAE